MVGTCALNDMNANMKLIGIFILIILLSIVVIYFMYCSRNKHSEILENFTSNEATLTYHNYGSEHTGPYTDDDKKTITGNVTLRDCQVYFVGEDQQGDCDEEYRANPNTTCKYVFKDDWKEIANIKVGEGEGNNYANKIYNQSYTYTENDIKNHHLTAQCVKKFESESDKRYIYRDNELIVYNHDGSSDGNTLELNYKTDESDESDEYVKGDFISMKFGNNGKPSDNYTNVIDSICSKRYNDQPNLKVGDIFYKFILNGANEIISVKYAKVKSDKKSFEIVDIDLNEFSDTLATAISYENNKIVLSKGNVINVENVKIYKFYYDYFCNSEHSGIIKSFIADEFTMNKKFVNSPPFSIISASLLNLETSAKSPIIIPDSLHNLFNDNKQNLKSIDYISGLLDNEASKLIRETNETPIILIKQLGNLVSKYDIKKKEAVALKESFGIGKTSGEIFNYTLEKISSPGPLQSTVNNDMSVSNSELPNRVKTPINMFGFVKGYKIYDIDDNTDISYYTYSPNPINIPGVTENFYNYLKSDYRPSYQNNVTQSLCAEAESKTGVKGWRLVRFLPPTSGKWYKANDNLAGTAIYGNPTDFTSEFSLPFGNFDEFLFSTKGFNHWLQVSKDQAIGTNYSNQQRIVIKSSISSTSYTAAWYNRTTLGEDPWIGLRSHGKQPVNNPSGGGDLILYGENSYGNNGHWSLPAISMDGGMCVFVRDSTITESINPDTYDKLYTLTHKYNSGKDHTVYTLTFKTNVIADILIVGGGGSSGHGDGASWEPGGGGGGQVVYMEKKEFEKGIYTIEVGRGGYGQRVISRNGRECLDNNQKSVNNNNCKVNHPYTDGMPSKVLRNGMLVKFDNIALAAGGGAGGGTGSGGGKPGTGGSGGGGTHRAQRSMGGHNRWNTNTIWDGSKYVRGYNAGANGQHSGTNDGGGGGGAGSPGYADIGGSGFKCNITGIDKWYGGGGGASGHSSGSASAMSLAVQNERKNKRREMLAQNSGGGGYVSGHNRNAHHMSKIGQGSPGFQGTGGGGGAGFGSMYAVKTNYTQAGGSGVVIIKVHGKAPPPLSGIADDNVVIVEQHIKDEGSNIDSYLFEPFTSGNMPVNIKSAKKKSGVIGSYIFFESGYFTDLNLYLSNEGNDISVFKTVSYEIISINNGYDETVLITNKTFTIPSSGFYKFKCTYILHNVSLGTKNILLNLTCVKDGKIFDLKKDYMYKGRVWPESFGTDLIPGQAFSANIFIKVFNNTYLSGLKMSDNNYNSLKKLMLWLNDETRDLFNVNYWNKLYDMASESKNSTLLLDNNCDHTIGGPSYRTNCALLKTINRLNENISVYKNNDKIVELFEGKSFPEPTFKSGVRINDEFTNTTLDINNFITVEKEDNYLKRTQNNIEDPFFRFAENAEKSIYVAPFF